MDTPTQLDGFKAASLIVRGMLNYASKERPEDRDFSMRETNEYKEGYYNGLLFAHCQHALGEYPSFNVEAIRKALNGS